MRMLALINKKRRTLMMKMRMKTKKKMRRIW
jgi:hypothetical protein